MPSKKKKKYVFQWFNGGEEKKEKVAAHGNRQKKNVTFERKAPSPQEGRRQALWPPPYDSFHQPKRIGTSVFSTEGKVSALLAALPSL